MERDKLRTHPRSYEGEPNIVPLETHRHLLKTAPGTKVTVSTDDNGGFVDGILREAKAGTNVILVYLEGD